jgi:AIPR protein
VGITEKDLEQCHRDLGSRFGGHKNDYFALLYLAQEFKGAPIDYGADVAFGGSDYGFDAFHIDREARNLYLYQFKWSSEHSLFKESLRRIVDSGFAMVFGDPKQDKQANQFITQLKNALDENQAVIDRVYVRFVFNGDPDAADRSRVLDALREDLESKRFLLDQFFEGRAVALTIDFVSNETKRRSQPTKQKRSHTYRFPLDRAIDVATSDGQCRMHVGFVPLMAIHGWYTEMGPRLFNRNIRMGLDGEKPTNRAIKASLRAIADGATKPEMFALDHNGVTLSVEHFHYTDGIASVTEPRVLNGAQTITTVGRFLEEPPG